VSAQVIEAIDGAVAELVPLLGAKAACQAVGVPRASYYRGRLGDEPDQPGPRVLGRQPGYL